MEKEDVKAVLEKKGYEFPEFKDRSARTKFVKGHGYDPDLLLTDTVGLAKIVSRMGGDWERFVPECPAPVAQKRKGKKKRKKK